MFIILIDLHLDMMQLVYILNKWQFKDNTIHNPEWHFVTV